MVNMQYILLRKGQDMLSMTICSLLQKELSWLDVRAEFQWVLPKQKIDHQDVQVMVSIGSSAPNKSLYSFHLAFNSLSNWLNSRSFRKSQVTYSDIPISRLEQAEYQGCILFDVFRSVKIGAKGNLTPSVVLISGLWDQVIEYLKS